MKSNLLRIFFEWALITSVLMSVGFFAWYWIGSRAVHSYQSQIAGANDHLQRAQLVMTRLEADCNEYAKTSPDFARFLEALKGGSTAPASPKPAAK